MTSKTTRNARTGGAHVKRGKPLAGTESATESATEPAAGVILTARDLAVAADAWAFGLLTRDQIHELHFPDAALRRVNRRLLALSRAGILAGAPLPLGGHPLAVLAPATVGAVLEDAGPGGPGGGQRAYRLGARGAEPVARYLAALGWDTDADAVRRRTASAETPGFAAHALAVADARIALERAARRAGTPWRLRGFFGEALLSHAYEVRDPARPGGWRREVFKPDGLAVFEIGGAVLHAFVEIDLSSVAAAEIAHKLAIHSRYRTALFPDRYPGTAPDGFVTLVLTTGARRAENLARLAARDGLAPFARAATLAALADPAADPLLSPVWHVPGLPGTHPLFRSPERLSV